MTMLNKFYAGSDSDSDAASSHTSNEDTTFYLVHQENDSEDEAAAAAAVVEGTTSTVLGGGGSGGFDGGEELDCQNSAGSAVVVPKDTTTATSTSSTAATMDIKSFENETIVIPQSFDVATQFDRMKEGKRRIAVTLIQDDSTEAIHVPEDDEDKSVTAEEEEHIKLTRMKRISFQSRSCTRRSILQVLFGMVLISVVILTPYMYHARERTLLDEISSLQNEIKELQEALKPEPDVQVDNCWFNAKASMGLCSKEQLDSLKEVSNEVWDQFYSVMDWVNTPLSMEGEKSPLNNPLSKSLLEILYPSSSSTSEKETK